VRSGNFFRSLVGGGGLRPAELAASGPPEIRGGRIRVCVKEREEGRKVSMAVGMGIVRWRIGRSTDDVRLGSGIDLQSVAVGLGFVGAVLGFVDDYDAREGS